MDNLFISYYGTPRTSRVKQLRLIVFPVKFIQVVISACHVSPLSGHIHEQRTLFRILAMFWWPMVNKEVAQFIRACAHFQLVYSLYHEAKQLLHAIESDAPFEVVLLEFWVPGYIPDCYGSRKIPTFLYCMTGFWLGLAIWLKEIISYQAAQWSFVNFFVPFGLPKMIVVDADGFFAGMFRNVFTR